MIQKKKKEIKDADGFIEIPFGAFDSETISWTYTIPEGFTAKIEDGKIIVEKKVSDDKQIINALTKRIQDMYDNETAIYEGVQVSDILAWLEKQKAKEKYDRMAPIYKDRESFESALEKAWNNYSSGALLVDGFEDNRIELAHAKGFREGFLFGNQQKSAEWSEDFEDNIRNLLHDKLTGHSEDGSMSWTTLIDDETLKDIVNGIWFYIGKEALKYPNKELSQPEWSEEDEKMAYFIDQFLEYHEASDPTAKSCKDWFNSRFKSLRPQPHWKPSEEQINALAKAIITLGEQGDNKTVMYLNEIRTELKKL